MKPNCEVRIKVLRKWEFIKIIFDDKRKYNVYESTIALGAFWFKPRVGVCLNTFFTASLTPTMWWSCGEVGVM